MQKITKIETEDDYRDALNRFIELCKANKTNDDLGELLLLTNLMEKYERAHCGSN
jgi:antitoxin component HigA of HigAB toxin-antitoxin module